MISTAALLTSAVLLSIAVTSAQAQNRQDYCEYSQRSVAIFVDRTTQYDKRDKEIFVEGFDRILGRLSLGDRVAVHTIQDSFAESEVVFETCVPGCPDEGFMNWLLGSCKSVVARADITDFKVELARSIRALLDNPQSYPHSDIARTIATVSETYSSRGRSDGGKPLKLVFLFSDLLENSEFLSWQKIAQLGARQASARLTNEGIQPRLSGANVAAFGIGRFHDKGRRPLAPSEEQLLKAFWNQYLETGDPSEVYIGTRLN